MDSDDCFGDFDLDAAAFEQLDAIEAAAFQPANPSHAGSSRQQPVRQPAPIAPERSLGDISFDIDPYELEKLDPIIEQAYQNRRQPTAGPSRQTTLFGDVLPLQTQNGSKPRSQIQRTKSAPRNPFGQQAPKTKVWDQTAFAKSGLKRGKSKGKAKARADNHDSGEDFGEEEIEFEQFPAPFVSACQLGQYPPPMKLKPDLLEAKHWIYPLNKPKRDYQFNIVKHCLFENTIVALPTGLGKTFIAGVVMLNFYRWFPDGRVVFVAPTKPLVAQQIDACHQVCGIPGSDAVELTGQNPKPMRARAWREKRIFYMTPQTLINDLTSENCEVRDIILLVIDEAHRATGDYAYNQVVRFMMAKNPHFRILALTATPGGNPDAVQTLIDGLHISRIEIRDENSLDLKQYIHEKTIEQHIIKMSDDVVQIRDLLAKLMETFIKPLKSRGILWGAADPLLMHPYAPQARMASLDGTQRWAYGPLSRLSSLARAMGYLVEGTIGMCYTCLQELSREPEREEDNASGKRAASKAKKLRADPLFQELMQELEKQRNRGFALHPKMDTLKTLAVQHFGGKMGETGEPEETRVMIFVTFREAVDEIVEALNAEKPLIRAHKFIGQGTDKQGNRGLAQREQLEIIKKFKSGEINALVATSIGEEGLDIGEVDLIICYDSQKTPIRMLQRLGRTGRKRAGVVHVLLAEGREEFNFDKAKTTYKEVQKTIWRGDQLELYADVERLLPDHIKPECLEKPMEIQEYVREEPRRTTSKKRATSPEKPTKRKRNDDIARNIPLGASTGFVSVADLIVKGSKKQKTIPPPKEFEQAAEDDDTDMDLESGSVLAPPRRTKSSASAQKKSKMKPTLRKAATLDPNKSKVKKKAKKTPTKPDSSPFSEKAVDDSDDLDIERGLTPAVRSGSLVARQSVIPERFTSKPTPRKHLEEREEKLPSATSLQAILELSSTDSDSGGVDDISPLRENPDVDQSIAWLVDDDDEPNIEILSSSPALSKEPSLGPTTEDESVEFVEPQTLDDSIEIIDAPRVSKPHGVLKPSASKDDDPDPFIFSSPILFEELDPVYSYQRPSKIRPRGRGTGGSKLSSPGPFWNFEGGSSPNSCGLPLPTRSKLFSPGPEDTSVAPTPSFPVRAGAKRRRIALDSPDSDISSGQHKRLQPHESPAPKSRDKGKPRSLGIMGENNPLFDFAAVHSGDEVSEGSSHGEDDVESESDRRFLQELPETQVSPSYDQSLVYRQSLFTQPPAGGLIPAFAHRPNRREPFRGRSSSKARKNLISSSPSLNSEPDEYDIGSFVVDDDAEISYTADRSGSL
ncbi:hypothetical protein BD779DRAFT_1666229 [Infundibulicybe gibba]|nr:hypothetical protein BD779DRAFT_1666229 [Infundibulicybe gibba]